MVLILQKLFSRIYAIGGLLLKKSFVRLMWQIHAMLNI